MEPSKQTSLRLNQRPYFSFLGLPGEIRNKIYHTALLDDTDIDMRSKKPAFRQDLSDHYRRTDEYNQDGAWALLQANQAINSADPKFALLRTCRQIYLEAYKIYYGCNTFSFDSQAFYDFFERPDHLESRVTDEIKSARIFLYQYPISEQLAELSVYSKIEKLNLFLPQRLSGDEGYSCALPKDILQFPHLTEVSLSRWDKTGGFGNVLTLATFEHDRRYQAEATELLLQRNISNNKQQE
ncbi:MAG: hypothetical protein M1812_004496 [Candelaria pacifica]|nr:MAG: hypothetical protein M1812_004496 [Candelaria pacifica]